MKYILPSIALGLMPLSLNAQEVAQQDPVAAATPQQDLDCAIISGLAGASSDAEDKTTYIVSMAYYIGRFEAVSGSEINVEAPDRLQPAKLDDILLETETCLAKLGLFSIRLNEFGETLKSFQSESENVPSSDN